MRKNCAKACVGRPRSTTTVPAARRPAHRLRPRCAIHAPTPMTPTAMIAGTRCSSCGWTPPMRTATAYNGRVNQPERVEGEGPVGKSEIPDQGLSLENHTGPVRAPGIGMHRRQVEQADEHERTHRTCAPQDETPGGPVPWVTVIASTSHGRMLTNRRPCPLAGAQTDRVHPSRRRASRGGLTQGEPRCPRRSIRGHS